MVALSSSYQFDTSAVYKICTHLCVTLLSLLASFFCTRRLCSLAAFARAASPPPTLWRSDKATPAKARSHLHLSKTCPPPTEAPPLVERFAADLTLPQLPAFLFYFTVYLTWRAGWKVWQIRLVITSRIQLWDGILVIQFGQMYPWWIDVTPLRWLFCPLSQLATGWSFLLARTRDLECDFTKHQDFCAFLFYCEKIIHV